MDSPPLVNSLLFPFLATFLLEIAKIIVVSQGWILNS